MSNTTIFVILASVALVISATLAILALCKASAEAEKAHKEFMRRQRKTPSTRPTNTSTLSFSVPPFIDCASQSELTHPTDWLKVLHYGVIGLFAVVISPLFASGAAYVVATVWGQL